MARVRVKICGITQSEDATQAMVAGADALGLVFYERSPRAIDIKSAIAISAAAGPFITLVGLFGDAEPEEVAAVLAQVPLQLLQFHGDESPSYCEAFGRPYIKAIRMRPDVDLDTLMAAHPKAQGFLLDAYRPGVPGGTGETFDWQRVPRNSNRPIVLAGGLTPDNVAEAVAQTQPYAVDVSGGVEASAGRKDAYKVKKFIQNAKLGAS